MLAIFDFLILIPVLWLFAGAVLFLHRLSSRFGLAPLLVFLGGMTAALEYSTLGFFKLAIGDHILELSFGSFILLPVILFTILIIYVINGTLATRSVFAGVLIITLFIAVFIWLPLDSLALPNIIRTSASSANRPANDLIASAIALAVDMIVLISVYQWISNHLSHSPSFLAFAPTLLLAANLDSIIYLLLSQTWSADTPYLLFVHLLMKTGAAIALWPLLGFYFLKVASSFPGTVAAAPRPTLDLFTTSQKLEARARYHYNLFHTLTQANKLIGNAQRPQPLLDGICQLLIEKLDSPLAWIGLFGDEYPGIRPVAYAGSKTAYLKELASRNEDELWLGGPVGTALQTGQATARLDIHQSGRDSPWKEITLQFGLDSCAALPMRHGEHRLGALVVYGSRNLAFHQVELDLLQELADSLANSLINLGARRQQMVLYHAAETMADGLIITDLQREIIYANPAVSSLFHSPDENLLGKNLWDLIQEPEEREALDQRFSELKKEEKVAFDLEHRSNAGRISFFSIRAALVRDIPANLYYMVVNIRDITRSRQYERLLLTLHQYSNDIVQAHKIEELLGKIFQAGEELLRADSSGIELLAADAQTVVEVYRHNLPEIDTSREIQDFRDSPGGQALVTRLPVVVGDILSDPRYADRLRFLSDSGLRALLVFPVLFQGVPIGSFSLYYRWAHQFSEEEIRLGETFVQTLAIAIQNARLYGSEHHQRQLAEALAQAAMALNSSLDLEDVLEEILRQVQRVLPCRSVNLMLIEGEAAIVVRNMEQAGSVDRTGQYISSKLPLSTASLRHMLETGQPVLAFDTGTDPDWVQLEQSAWIRSYAGAPLVVDEKIIGFLNLNSDQANFFSQETAHHLQTFASYAAAAIQNARLYRQLQEYATDLERRVSERTIELSEAKERLESILVSVPDAIFVLDEGGRPFQANPAGENLLALADHAGQDLFSPALLDHLKGETRSHEKAIVEMEGRAYQALASSLPIHSIRAGSVVVFRDVTHFRELDRIKSKFVSDVSHELRTPLTNLSLYIDLLSTAANPLKSEKYLDTLRRETERLTDLIEDLLTISRLEAGRIEIRLQAVDVNRLVSDLVNDRLQIAKKMDLGLEYIPAQNLPAVRTDPRLLTQVLSNLLTNALNYTPAQGSIRILSANRQEKDGDWITIAISDSGVGILPEDWQQLFTRFYRGTASRATGAPGTGLGLAISKEITECLGGHIRVQSQPGCGSTFTVWLKSGDML